MRLLQYRESGELSFHSFEDGSIPPYAILSHTWGADGDEVTFAHVETGDGRTKPGYKKIVFCGERARHDGLEYFWIDTCCINKSNKAELSYAINSMFRWYQKAVKCYVYLSDVSSKKRKVSDEYCRIWEPAFRASKWFTRGWTLQELLAPSAVEFFCSEGKWLDTKISLAQQIHEITGIPKSAITGTRLSQFPVDERLSWIQHRQTKLEEDRTYSLLGILDVYIAPFYGEGTASAFQRLREELSNLGRCIQDVRLTDPLDDKKRIVDTKGGLLEDSYRWVLNHPSFKKWRSDPQSRLLWIKGDPGKGKTMLFCGLTGELGKSTSHNLSFFFCQGTNSDLNNATAVLRGLLYLLVSHQPRLASHLRKKYDQAGRSLFEDTNAWIAVSEMFTSIILDPDLRETYLVVDALDECIADLPKLLNLIIHTSSSNRIKWLLSSRNELHIEQRLKSIDVQARLSLELKQNAEQVARTVDLYIDEKLSYIDSLADASLRTQVREILRQKANGTFLWVALVVQELEKPESWDPVEVVEDAPVGLHQLYDRMVNQIQQLPKRNSEMCRLLLSTVSVAYRPLHLAELGSLCKLRGPVSTLTANTRTLVAMCGSFLTIRDDQVYLIHQSAKDYLDDEARAAILLDKGEVHYKIFSQSLKLMSSTLKRDMYGLGALGCPIEKVTRPATDPLATARYSCVHWIDHLYESTINKNGRCNKDLQDDGTLHAFLQACYLYWLEALSLCKSISAGVAMMGKLEILLQGRTDAPTLTCLIHDARRFVLYSKQAIEGAPLQAYGSALLFSPTGSLIRKLFHLETPEYISIRPVIGSTWSACLQTLEGHSNFVKSVAFSHDSARLVSGSRDHTVKIWDASSGTCLQTLKGHVDWVILVAFSHDSTRVLSGSFDHTVKIWDASSGTCLQTLKGHTGWVNSVAFSHDSVELASGSEDCTIKIWNVSSGECLQTLKDPTGCVRSVAFSHDSTRLVSVSVSVSAQKKDETIRLWDPSRGKCLQILQKCNIPISSAVFSHDSALLALVCYDGTIALWDGNSGEWLQRLASHDPMGSVAFSHDSAQLASGSPGGMIQIWDSSSGECVHTLEGHTGSVSSVAFSHDSVQLASGSEDCTIKIWNVSSRECLQTPNGHTDEVSSVAFSHNLVQLASGSVDCTIKIWDVSSGECLQTLQGHTGEVISVAFSHDSAQLASGSEDCTIKIWNVSSGECLQTLKGHSDPVYSVAFSGNSTRLASASYSSRDDCVHKLWDTSTSMCLQNFASLESLQDYNTCGCSVAISHDAAQLASTSCNCTIELWDVSNGERLQTLKGHGGQVTSVAFTHDSALLASGSRDGTVKIWDLSCGTCLQTYSIGTTLNRISFDSKGLYLHTDIGTIDISAPSGATSFLINPEPCSPRYHGIGISADGEWITYKSEHLVRLPPEYRGSCSAVSGSTIGIAVGSGKVWIFKIELDRFLAMGR